MQKQDHIPPEEECPLTGLIKAFCAHCRGHRHWEEEKEEKEDLSFNGLLKEKE